MPFIKAEIDSAKIHLCEADPIMGYLMDHVGSFSLKLDNDRFGILVRSIISQQISTQAARSIQNRLVELLGSKPPTAIAIKKTSDTALRSVGLSPQKRMYLQDLSTRELDGRLQLQRIGRLHDEAAIEHLIQVKGIGRWTAQMFLIFSLGRLNVLPHDDFGVKTSIRNRYGFSETPSQQQIELVAASWKPFCSVATWYLWRSLKMKINSATALTTEIGCVVAGSDTVTNVALNSTRTCSHY